ncbi:MAG TPA: hypothetical protein V6C63_12820 [Allocoleopsis sp.]
MTALTFTYQEKQQISQLLEAGELKGAIAAAKIATKKKQGAKQ